VSEVQKTPDAAEALARLMERYDLQAESYRELWAPVLRSAALPLVRELADDRARTVLDVGTGVGALLPDLEAAFPAGFVIGCDRSHGMLALAPARYGRALMDARALAIASDRADRVFLLFMLFHLEDPASALSEARRVLRVGGRVGTLTWAGELESTASCVWIECLDHHGAIAPDPAVQLRDETVNTPEKMEALLRDTGFAEARAWMGPLVHTLDTDHLVRLKTNLGSQKPRFDSLSPEARVACVEDARHRMDALKPEDFIARGDVVYATATSRGGMNG
jgi:SAM-dependent methyltransferase